MHKKHFPVQIQGGDNNGRWRAMVRLPRSMTTSGNGAGIVTRLPDAWRMQYRLWSTPPHFALTTKTCFFYGARLRTELGRTASKLVDARWRLVLRILVTESADPTHRRHALLKCREPAIRAAASAGTVISTPRIILRFGSRDH